MLPQRELCFSHSLSYSWLTRALAVSWSFWANVYAASNLERFFDWGNGPASDNLLFTCCHSSKSMGISIYNGGGHVDHLTGATPSISTWNHFAFTVDASGNVCVYQNGTLLASVVNFSPNTVVRTQMFLGHSNWPADPYFNGAMYDFQFALGYVFTAYDVTNLFNGLGCPPSPPPPFPPPSPPLPPGPPSPPLAPYPNVLTQNLTINTASTVSTSFASTNLSTTLASVLGVPPSDVSTTVSAILAAPPPSVDIVGYAVTFQVHAANVTALQPTLETFLAGPGATSDVANALGLSAANLNLTVGTFSLSFAPPPSVASPSPLSSSVAAVAGAVGGFVFILLTTTAVCFIRRRRIRRPTTQIGWVSTSTSDSVLKAFDSAVVPPLSEGFCCRTVGR